MLAKSVQMLLNGKLQPCSYLLMLGLALQIVAVAPSLVLAESRRDRLSNAFAPSDRLLGRVEFWKLIFTKYGKDQAVFHHRQHPEIIYSVVDFSDYAAKWDGRRLAKEKNSASDKEEARIRNSLLHLAKGKRPRDDFEKRVEELFAALPGSKKRNYREAAKEKMIRSQTGIKERFRMGVERSGRYLQSIEEIFAAEGLPPELGRLPLVESSFDYNAYSSVGAAGIWQFMRSTGRRYLRITTAIDERQDPILATRAAARYLGYSYQKLESWPLAVTSYNHGLNGIMRAANTTGTKDLHHIIHHYESRSFGFASQNFFPELLAAIDVERNKELYFPGIQVEKPLLFDEIQLSRSLRYSDFVKYSGVSEETLRAYNKALLDPVRRGRVKIPKGFIVKVPRGKGSSLLAKLGRGRLLTLAQATQVYRESEREVRAYSRSADEKYRVSSGDTIGALARRFGVSQRAIMEANNIRDPRRLRLGQRLVIPGRRERTSSRSITTAGSHYKVRSGDSIDSIAADLGVGRQNLVAVNNIVDANKIFVGQKLKIPSESGSSTQVSSSAKQKYTVVKGDSLSVISRKLGTSVGALVKANPGLDAKIFPGQTLAVP